MSGLGRKSHYRKHLTDNILTSLPEPTATSMVARVLGSRGGNIIEIELPVDKESDNDCSAASPNKVQSSLALMPTKFHKLIWVKRNDFLIVTGAAGSYETSTTGEEGKVQHMVSHILFREQVRHIKQVGMWPAAFQSAEVNEDSEGEEGGEPAVAGEDGIVYRADEGPPPGDGEMYGEYEEGEYGEGGVGEEEEAGGGYMDGPNPNHAAKVRQHVESDSDSDEE